MEAAKFLKEFGRMCSKHIDCKNCPLKVPHLCLYNGHYSGEMSQEKLEMTVEVVENWSKKNPDMIGKKYIIEIDKVEFDSTYEKTMLRIKGVKFDGGEVWLDKELIEQFAKSKE